PWPSVGWAPAGSRWPSPQRPGSWSASSSPRHCGVTRPGGGAPRSRACRPPPRPNLTILRASSQRPAGPPTTPMSVQATTTHRAHLSNDLNHDEHAAAPTYTALTRNPPNLTWPELTEPPRADDGRASWNQLKADVTGQDRRSERRSAE